MSSANLTPIHVYLSKVLARRYSFSRVYRQPMLVILRTRQVTWARAGFFVISTVGTSEHLLNIHYTKLLKENELILYIWIPPILILE